MRLGRAPQAEAGELGWAIPWDRLISRNHADLVYQNGGLKSAACPAAAIRSMSTMSNKNINSRCRREGCFGSARRCSGSRPRKRFSMRRGRRTAQSEIDPTSLTERVYSMEELRATEFGNAGDRMEVFSKLPKLLAESRTDAEFAKQLVALLLPTIPLGQAAAVIRCSTLPGKRRVGVRSGPQRAAGRPRGISPQPATGSRGPAGGHQPGSTVGPDRRACRWISDSFDEEATNSLNLEWAICVPVPDRRHREWCLYVTGKFAMNGQAIVRLDDLKPDVRYIELLAQFVGAARQVRLAATAARGLGAFLLAEHHGLAERIARSARALAPAMRHHGAGLRLARLFPPSRAGPEQAAAVARPRQPGPGRDDAEHLPLRRRRGRLPRGFGPRLLGLAVRQPRRTAAGVPHGPVDPRGISQSPSKTAAGPLADLRIGIGIAHGPGLAGKIGTEDHAKVGAFGPVVERGSRLESLTKMFRASIILDEAAALAVREHLSPEEGRCRRLGRVRLPGLESPADISELLPPVRSRSLADRRAHRRIRSRRGCRHRRPLAGRLKTPGPPAARRPRQRFPDDLHRPKRLRTTPQLGRRLDFAGLLKKEFAHPRGSIVPVSLVLCHG